jgi:hypothetical protein
MQSAQMAHEKRGQTTVFLLIQGINRGLSPIAPIAGDWQSFRRDVLAADFYSSCSLARSQASVMRRVTAVAMILLLRLHQVMARAVWQVSSRCP